MTRGQLPKAYLRLDPNIDHAHPDNLDGFIRLLCAANRQPVRGQFSRRSVLDHLFGKTATDRLYRRGDVQETGNGVVLVPGWSTWQEGDLSVGERVRRFRERHRPAVTGGVTDTVTEPLAAVTGGVTNSLPASEALGQLGSEASSNGLPTTERVEGALPTEATRRKTIKGWTQIGLIDWSQTLDRRQLASWADFGPEWEPFRAAWVGRGLRYAPSGTAEDDPNAANPSQRALLYSILAMRPNDLVTWVNESPKGSVSGVIRHVLERWHAVRDEAGAA